MNTPQTYTPETKQPLDVEQLKRLCEAVALDCHHYLDTTLALAKDWAWAKLGHESLPALNDFLDRLTQPSDRANAAEAKLAKWESELSKVMPQDFKDWWQNSRDEWPEVASMVIEGLRKQAEMTDKAAEARVKELESAILFKETCQTCNATCDPADVEAGECIWCIAKQFKRERDEARAALRLRPIVEAGPVPEGAVRVYGYRPIGYRWLFTDGHCSRADTHFIDIYPPQQ